jgi:hypothetical protein
MPTAYINGLPPQDGTNVAAFSAEDWGQTERAEAVWRGTPNESGMVTFFLPPRLIGKSIQVVVIGGRAEYLGQRLPVSRLGVFHTVSLRLDRTIYPDSREPLLPPDWFVQSQSAIHRLHRHAKYKNYIMTSAFAIATVASVYAGLLIDGLPGLAVGAGLTVASLGLGNYASGFSRGL